MVWFVKLPPEKLIPSHPDTNKAYETFLAANEAATTSKVEQWAWRGWKAALKYVSQESVPAQVYPTPEKVFVPTKSMTVQDLTSAVLIAAGVDLDSPGDWDDRQKAIMTVLEQLAEIITPETPEPEVVHVLQNGISKTVLVAKLQAWIENANIDAKTASGPDQDFYEGMSEAFHKTMYHVEAWPTPAPPSPTPVDEKRVLLTKIGAQTLAYALGKKQGVKDAAQALINGGGLL